MVPAVIPQLADLGLEVAVQAGVDEILRHTLVAQGGDVVHPQLRESLGLPPLFTKQEA